MFTTRLYTSITIVALLFSAFAGFEAWKWKKIADKRGFYAEQAGAYLFAPSGVIITASGEELTRQQLLDHLLHTAVERTPGLHFKK